MFALVLDVATLLHGFIVVWVVLTYSRHWDYWDARMAGSDPGYTLDDVWSGFVPVTLLLTLAWSISVAAASFVWLRILRAPPCVGRRGAV